LFFGIIIINFEILFKFVELYKKFLFLIKR